MINVGDESDMACLNSYKLDIDADYTANQEIEELLETMKEWYKAFPQMKVCNSNHQARFWKKAWQADIPKVLLKKYRDFIEAPKGWQWKDQWIIKTKSPFAVQHGCGYSGHLAHRQAAIDNGMSTAIGHLHSKAGVNHIKTNNLDVWGMNTGSLIDEEAYAFKYSKHNRYKANIGCGVVLNDGKLPIFVPMDSL